MQGNGLVSTNLLE